MRRAPIHCRSNKYAQVGGDNTLDVREFESDVIGTTGIVVALSAT